MRLREASMVIVRFRHAVLQNPYGVRVSRHPDLSEWWWIDWDSGRPGYYRGADFRILGTAFD